MKVQVIVRKGEVIVTQSDVEMVKHFADDKRSPEVAQILGIHKRTLDARSDKLRAKFGLKTIAGLVAIFYRNGLID